MKTRLPIKPLSTNNAWQGKRFKTPSYVKFQRDMLLLLPNVTLQSISEVHLHFGFSSKLSDLDNAVKQSLDCIVKKYGIDDRYINKIVLTKEIVQKGNEFIDIQIL
jgi:Holliday junction resolvase RusA-like endonuclease